MKPFIIKSNIYKDKRGYFKEIFLKKKINFNFKFTAFSFSKKNVIRGLHYQFKKPQKKFVSVVRGNCIDVCVNINPKSKYFKKIFKFYLEPGKMLFIPEDYAHGFGVLSKELFFFYHMDNYRYAQYESGIAYNDPYLKINWEIKKPIVSLRDQKHPNFHSRKKLFLK